MEIKKNQEVYYLPYARLSQDVDAFGVGTLEKGNEYPINVNNIANNQEGKTPVIVHSKHGCNVVQLADEDIETFVKRVIPKFKLGQVVKNIKSGSHFRIWEIDIVQGKVWYRNGWSVATGCENGVHEENLVVVEDDGQWDVEYNDHLVEKANPKYWEFVMNKKVA